MQMLLLDPTVVLKWDRCDPLPHPRKHLHAVELGGKVYIGSGYGPRAGDDIGPILYCFDIETKKWMDCPQSLTLYFAMASFDGKILLIGGKMRNDRQADGEVEATGQVQANDEVKITVNHSPSNRFLATGKIQHLSLDEKEWKFCNEDEMSSLPTARMGAVATSLGNNLIVAGGYGSDRNRVTVVEIYDKCSNLWFSGDSLPVKAAEFKTAISHGDQWYLLGGANQYKAVVTTSLKKLITKAVSPLASGHSKVAKSEQETAKESVWTSLTNLPHEFSCTAVFGGSLVVFGGEKESIIGTAFDNFYSTMLIYDNHQQAWIHFADMPYQLSKCTAITLSTGDLLLVGGHSKHNKPEDVIYRCSLMPSEEAGEEERVI